MSAVSLGLDASRDRLGWGIATLDGEPVDCGCESIAPPGVRGRKPDGYDERRPDLIRAALDGLLSPSEPPALITLEAPYIAKSGQTAVELALAVGSVWQAVTRLYPGASVGFMQPGEWKAAADVPPDPREGRKTVKGARLREMVARELESDDEPEIARAIRRLNATGLKPWPMAVAMMLGFRPEGSQDAADAGCIAVARARVNALAFA